jgi:pimeloyl-ACP methyl ester carboxylesterase
MPSAYRSPSHGDEVRSWCRAALARWSVPHEAHVIDTCCGDTHVLSAGEGDGDAVCVYLPGTNFTTSSSSVVLEELATRLPLYAADLPGQPGLSAPVRPKDEVSGYAGWVEQLVSWVHSRHPDARIVLAGHSRGSAVAMLVNPDTVHGLALLSPAGFIAVRPTRQMLRATLPWLLRRNAAGARRLLEYMSGRRHTAAQEQVEWMTLVARACRTTGAPRALPDATLNRWRGRNVSLVVGDHDVFFPVSELSKVCLSKLGTNPVVVQGAGHLLVDEEPQQVVTHIAELLQ